MPLDRKKEILKHINKDGLGLEIGASHNPITPKRDGYNVHILDCKDKKGLIEEYSGHNVNLDNIEEVDFIWSGENYHSLIGDSNCYDWIIASHVIEHTTDLVGFLLNCEKILKPEGILSLAIPDRRFCFDHYRPISSLSQVLDKHYQSKSTHSPGTIAEYYLNAISKNGRIAWEQGTSGPIEFIHNTNTVKQMITKAEHEDMYIDAHAWCFVPTSFELLIQDIKSLDLISIGAINVSGTYGCEFFANLSLANIKPEISRRELLDKVNQEIRITQ